VGSGHITYVRTWEGWLYLSFVLDERPGHLLQKDRRLVHGQQSEDGVGSRRREHGDLHLPSIARIDPSLRAWQPVHLCGVRQQAQRGEGLLLFCPRWDLWGAVADA
jgi:hypothetical protein